MLIACILQCYSNMHFIVPKYDFIFTFKLPDSRTAIYRTSFLYNIEDLVLDYWHTQNAH